MDVKKTGLVVSVICLLSFLPVQAEKMLSPVGSSNLSLSDELYAQSDSVIPFEDNAPVISYEIPKAKLEDKNSKENVKIIDRLYFSAADRYLQGEYDEAEKVIDKIIALDPKNRNALKLRERIKNITQAINDSDKD
ncbi:MAG: hypothetical protein ABII27_08555 [bacterium]